MPSYKPLAIAYADSGLVKDRQAYIPPNDAYVELLNAYVWRGTTKRRLAPSFLEWLRREITQQAQANTPAGPAVLYTIADVLAGFRATQPYSSIECGSLVITVDRGGVPSVYTDQGDGTLALTLGARAIVASSINYMTGAVSITFAVAPGVLTVDSTYSYFPTLPSMGIHNREIINTNVEDYVFFDTVYAYTFSGSNFIELPSTTPTIWTGSDSDFFWHTNYWNTPVTGRRLFWATNGKFGTTVATSDPIRYYDGVTWNAAPFYPNTANGTTNSLISAKIIIPFRGRLVALNTLEAAATAGPTVTQSFQNRARWCWVGDPTNIGTGWHENVQGRGGYADAPTTEAIITAGFVRDTLVVCFERSTWKLRYTGNEILPFVWERINMELGAESKKSIILFDSLIVAVGDKGITKCDGNNVMRIDDAIRDEVFNIHNGNNGVERVQGARNFFEQVVYWTFPSNENNVTYPNRVLLYNYDNGTWANFDDHFTALGPFQRTEDVTWSSLSTTTWAQYRRTWGSGRNQSGFPLVAGGNQQGAIALLNQKVTNDKSLHITAITAGDPVRLTVPLHNLSNGEIIEVNGILGSPDDALNGYRYQITVSDANNIFLSEMAKWTITAITRGAVTVITAPGNTIMAGDRIQLQNIGGTVQLNNRTFTVASSTGATITINEDSSAYTAYTAGGTVQNLDSIFDDVALASSAYIGCGEVTRISGFKIRSKQFSIMPEGARVHLGYMDFLVDLTEAGAVSVPIYLDYNTAQPINPRGADSFFNSEIPTTQIDFATQNATKVWHRLYCSIQAQFFQYLATLDVAQIVSKQLQASDFVLNAVIIWQDRGGRMVK